MGNVFSLDVTAQRAAPTLSQGAGVGCLSHLGSRETYLTDSHLEVAQKGMTSINW